MIYAIDCSGSTTGDQMLAMISFVRKQPNATKVVFFDTSVIKVVDAKTVSMREAPRGGGTLIQPVFDWMRDNAPREDLAVITDGWFAADVINTHGVRAVCYLTYQEANPSLVSENQHIGQRVVFQSISEMK